jgi:hypothetical protein
MPLTPTLDPQPHGHAAHHPLFLRQGALSLGTYATGGVAVSSAQLDFPADFQIVWLDVGSAGGYVFTWDKTNGKVLAYRQNNTTGPLVEVPNATDLSGVSARFQAWAGKHA